MKLDVYAQVYGINAGFNQIRDSLAALQRHRQFSVAELLHFRHLVEEARASLCSYLTDVIEESETAEAGRRFRQRRAQERRDESPELAQP